MPLRSVCTNEHIVLNPHANALELFCDIHLFRDIQSRLHGKQHTRCQYARLAIDEITPHIVNICFTMSIPASNLSIPCHTKSPPSTTRNTSGTTGWKRSSVEHTLCMRTP